MFRTGFKFRYFSLIIVVIIYLIIAHFVVVLEIKNTRVNNNGSAIQQRQEESGNFSTTSRRHLPSCIVIGVRKGGTRALLDMISMHSKVFAAKNEVHFFDVEENFDRGYSWYRDQMPPIDESLGQIAIEKTPSYFNTRSVAPRIVEMSPKIRLLLVVRDPVVRLISDYAQIAENHREKGRKFADFESQALNANSTVNTGYDAVKKSVYVDYLRHWLKFFPLEQLHVVNGDRFIRKPWQELRKVEDFLGLEHEIEESHFFFNATKGFHCVILQKAEKCLAKSKGRPHPKVSSKVIKKLRKYFSPFNYEFYSLVGRDFGWPED